MAKRITPHLSYAEYVSTDSDNSVQVWQARLRIIEAAKHVYPRFLNKLASDVFPVYRQLAESRKLAKEGYNFEKALWSENPQLTPLDVLAEEGGLKSALTKWATQFNAQVEWLMVGALRTLRDWHVAPDWRESLKWNTFHGRSETVAIGKDFEFRYLGWDVRLLTWSVYSESVRKRFEEKISEYERATREFAESLGMVRARRKYSRENFDWFVLYQFAGMSSTKIAERWAEEADGKAVDESTILKGVKAAAELIEWEHLRETGKTRNRKIR